MIWQNPSALFALAAVAAPIVIHLLVHRRAERFPFPTLRFLRPTRLAAIRRHVLDDVVLLAVRSALLAAAVAALAGPLLLTAARRHEWDARTVRALVVEDGTQARGPAGDRLTPYQEQTFQSASLADGIRRAILWLEAAPPARREIVVASAFPIGSIAPFDLAAVPADVGLHFERTGALPASRTVSGGRVLTTAGGREREVTFDGVRTLVREGATGAPVAWPIEVVTSKADRPIADAAVAAVLSQRVWAAPADRRASLVLAGPVQGPAPVHASDVARDSRVAQGFSPAISSAAAVQHSWMATAIVRIVGDRDLRAAGARVTAGLADARFASAPWQTLVSAADGRPLAAAAGSADRLLIASAAPASDPTTPLLLRAMADSIADPPDLRKAEVVPIAEATLRRWSRPSIPPASPRIGTLDNDDRRWLWLAVLCLMGLEMWLRRARSSTGARDSEERSARVA